MVTVERSGRVMKRAKKKVAADRKFVTALARGLDVLRAFHPNDGLLGNQEIAARTKLPKPTVSRLTYTLTQLGYLSQISRFEKYQLAPPAMSLGYAALANLGIRHVAQPHLHRLAQETGGDVAIGSRDRHQMIYFALERGTTDLTTPIEVGSRVAIATTAMGRAYLLSAPPEERDELLRHIREEAGTRWSKIRAGIERSAQTLAEHGYTISAGEWQEDIHSVGVPLRLHDGSGLYAFNCGASSFRFTEERLRADIGPRLVTVVRAIEAELNGTTSPSAPTKRTGTRNKTHPTDPGDSDSAKNGGAERKRTHITENIR
jgi:DNA-binding IclR family transcriptional regulator